MRTPIATQELPITPPVQPIQEYCMPVASHFGTPPDVELMEDPDFHTEVQEAIDLVEIQFAQNNMNLGLNQLETGEAAAKAINSLGCTACKLSGVCTVYENLEDRTKLGDENLRLANKLAQLTAAPTWLTAARLNIAETTLPELEKIVDGGYIGMKQAIENGSFDVDKLLGGTRNEFENLVSKQSVPELASMKHIDDEAQLESHIITTKEGDRFKVIDASEAFDFKGHSLQPSDSEYAILCAKLIGRMSQPDGQSHPQIMSADSNNKMQKVIARRGNATLYELRMSGKNRMYFWLDPTDADDITRISIIGAHGGDANTQKEFIKAALA